MDPFAAKNVFKLKELEVWPTKIWHGFQLDADLQSDSLQLAEGADVGLSDLEPEVLRLPTDETVLDDNHLHDAFTTQRYEDDHSSDQEQSRHSETDIWDVANLSCKELKYGLLSWDQFNDRDVDTRLVYLSEAGEEVFDAIVSRAWKATHNQSLNYTRLDILTQAALNVLVGRSSLVFKWNESSRSFESRLEQAAINGCSVELTVSLCKALCECGTLSRITQSFCKGTAAKNATTFAVQSALLQILHAVDADLQKRTNLQPTIVNLADICKIYSEFYKILQPIVRIAQAAGDEASILAGIIKYITEIWESNLPLRAMLTDLADRILQPSVLDTQRQIDLSMKPSAAGLDRWVLAFLLPEEVIVFQDIQRCLQVGRENSVQIRSSRGDLPPIRLVRQWSDIVEIQHVANSLESESCGIVVASSRNKGDQIRRSALSDDASVSYSNPFEVNFDMASHPLSTLQFGSKHDAQLSDLVLAALSGETTETEPDLSPIQMLSMSLEPILSAQHRICSYALLRSLFLQHSIKGHLSLLYSYHLLGNGSFATRLGRALFDADQYSAEGLRKTGLSAGLRLENRDVWPPASSELRLVLMGLLSDAPTDSDLPNLIEAISFAIRDLSEEEMELCRDVHSTHALDFLRLTYAPPNNILEVVITSSVLDKYDRVFRFLLILLRMHALTQGLVTSTTNRNAPFQKDMQCHRFCLELHHFVASLLDYALNVAISMSWNKISRIIDQVQNALQKDDFDGCMSVATSVSHLCSVHEETLDDILAALFLRTTQTKLYTATCEIFQLGLDVAQFSHRNSTNQTSQMQYMKLRNRLNHWISLVTLTRDRSNSSDVRMFEFLLNHVDHSRYYRQAQDVR